MKDTVITTTGVELLVSCIDNIVDRSINIHESLYDLDPLCLEDLYECKDLCAKILSYDYFKKSEGYLDRMAESCKEPNVLRRVTVEWDKLYKKDLEVKRKDLSRLFKLITNMSEEI